MNISEIDRLLELLPQASSEDLLRMDLQMRLGKQRDQLRRELEAEGEAARLDAPEPVAGDHVPYIAPMPVEGLLSVAARMAKTQGLLTHILVSGSVFMDILAVPDSAFRRVKSLPANARVKGFIDIVPVVLDQSILDGAMLRFENAQFEPAWVEIQVVR
jgi:hypothetical protein